MSGSVSQIYVVDDDLLVRESVGRRVWPEDKDLQVQIEEGENMNEHLPRVVIVGGGFGGLAAAKALRWSPVEVILIDRANHHLFQSLLYQRKHRCERIEVAEARSAPDKCLILL